MKTHVSDPKNLSLVSIEKDGYVRVAATGNLAPGEALPGGHNPLQAILGPDWATHRVLLDLSRAEYVDSSAIGWMIGSAKEFRARGGALVVHSVAPRVRRMLELLKLGQVVPLLPGEAAARQFLSDVRATPAAA